MSETIGAPEEMPAAPDKKGFSALPTTAMGWWAIGLAAAAVAALPMLVFLTANFKDTYPIVDSWVMPVIALVVLDAAAVVSVLAVWKAKERSALSLLVLFLTLMAGLFATMMVVGETIVPV